MNEANSQLAKRWFEEVWNLRNERAIDELMSPQGIGHLEGADVVGPEQFKTVRTQLLQAFPDFRVVVEGTVAAGDDVAVRWKVTGTHRGMCFGIEATGAPVAFRGITWFVIQNGRFIEGWDAWNQGALVETLKSALNEAKPR